MAKRGIAKPLKMAMVDKDITGVEMAEKLGIAPQTFYNTLHRDNVTFTRAVEMAAVLGCEIVLVDKATGKEYK